MTSEQNMQHHQQIPAYDDEIDLVDLWLVLLRRKWVIVSVFILTMVLAGVYLSLTTPVYESSARLLIGQVQGEDNRVRLLEDGRVLADRIKQMAADLSHDQAGLEPARFPTNKSMEITAQGEDAEQTFELIQNITSQILDDHSATLKRLTAPMRQQLNSIQERLEQADRLLDDLDKPVQSSEKYQDTLKFLEKSRLLTEVGSLEQQYMDLELRLDPVNTYPTTILSGPGYPEHPVKPRTGLVMALSVVLGLMLGVFAAFGCEFMSNARERIRQNKNQ